MTGWMKLGELVRRQYLQANQTGGQPDSLSHIQAGNDGRVPQRAAVSKDSQRLGEAKCSGIKRPHPSDHPAPDRLKTLRRHVRRAALAQRLRIQLNPLSSSDR